MNTIKGDHAGVQSQTDHKCEQCKEMHHAKGMSKRDNATGKEGTGKREYKNGEKGKESQPPYGARTRTMASHEPEHRLKRPRVGESPTPDAHNEASPATVVSSRSETPSTPEQRNQEQTPPAPNEDGQEGNSSEVETPTIDLTQSKKVSWGPARDPSLSAERQKMSPANRVRRMIGPRIGPEELHATVDTADVVREGAAAMLQYLAKKHLHNRSQKAYALTVYAEQQERCMQQTELNAHQPALQAANDLLVDTLEAQTIQRIAVMNALQAAKDDLAEAEEILKRYAPEVWHLNPSKKRSRE